MTQDKHANAPWWSEPSDHVALGPVFRITDEPGNTIGWFKNQEDALLAAAAPTLLEVLDLAEAMLCGYGAESQEPKELKAIREAIARVRGSKGVPVVREDRESK